MADNGATGFPFRHIAQLLPDSDFGHASHCTVAHHKSRDPDTVGGNGLPTRCEMIYLTT